VTQRTTRREGAASAEEKGRSLVRKKKEGEQFWKQRRKWDTTKEKRGKQE
jgi:hypothetical protein